MPHFIIDCNKDVVNQTSAQQIMRTVYDEADTTNLFGKSIIKVRIRPFEEYMVGTGQSDFIHVFGNIMEGRTIEQKVNLSRQIVQSLVKLYPDVPVISVNIREFERTTYCNRDML